MKLITISFIALLGAAAQQTQEQPAPTRAAFLKLVDRPRVPLAPQTQPMKIQGMTGTHFTFTSDSEQRVPGIMIKRADSQGRRPVVITLHGTGGSKEDFGGVLQELANRGFVAVAIDGRYHGERARSRFGNEYEDAIFRAYKTGKEHPLYYDTAWDVMRLMDYLETRDDVDPKRIGLLGISKGGIETYLTAAADPRVAVAVPCIGVQSFQWALEHDSWESRVGTFQFAIDRSAKDAGSGLNAQFVRKFYDRVVPGINSDFDGPAMLPLIAPRPLLVINGDSDSLTPMPGVLEAAAKATEAYAAAGAKEKFALRVQKNTGHDVTLASLQEAISWFTTWLKP